MPSEKTGSKFFQVMNLKILLLAIILVFVGSWFDTPVLAAEFFVDGAKGKEGNPGNRGLPLKTISQALAKAKAGDTVWVSGGTYREILHFRQGGTDAQHPLSIRAVRGAKVEIKGSDQVTDWAPHTGSIWKKVNWPVNSQQVFADGMPLQQIGENAPHNSRKYQGKPILPPVGKGLSDLVPGSFYYDQGTKVLYVWLKDNGNPNNQLIEASVRDTVIPPGPPQPSRDFIELIDLRFSHCNNTSHGGQLGVVNIAGRSWTVKGCSFTQGDYSGLRVMGEGHRIVNNVVNNNGCVGISLMGSDAAHQWKPYRDRPPQNLVLEGNETSFNNYRLFHQPWSGGGIKAIPSVNYVVVRKHKAEHNKGNGIWFDTWCQNIIIDQCTAANNEGCGIFYEVSDDAVISNNLVVNNGKNGIYIASSSGTKVFNNNVVGNNVGISIHGVPPKPREEHPKLGNNVVRNNIIANSKHADLVIYNNPALASNNTSDYNLYFRQGGGVKIAWTNDQSYKVNFTDLRAFATATGQEARSKNADPLWVNPAAGDYSLKPGSPAIGAGTADVGGVGPQDLRGRPRIVGGKIDLGAYAYGAR